MFNPIINPFTRPSFETPVLRDVFPDWKIGNGIFDALDEVDNMPWKDAADSLYLDLDYFGNHSGCKFVAPIIMNIIDQESLELIDSDRVLLATIIWTKFKEQWSRLWETNIVAYNPIHNYNMTDTRDLSKGESDSKISKTDSVDTTEHGKTSEGTSFVYGLNNDDANGKPSDRSKSEEGGETSVTVDSTYSDDSVKAASEHEETSRSGNIGVTTTQNMLTQEREVWMWNFFEQIYKDIDSVLSLSVYDPCRI